jgi:cell division septation protein DedD
MSPDRDPGRREDEIDEYDDEDESPRSIFSALWFRSLLAVLVLGVLAAVAAPYVLDFATSPALKTSTVKPPAATSPPGAPPPANAPAGAPAAPATAPVPTAAPSASAGATAAPASQPPSAASVPTAEPTKPAPARAPVAKPPAQVAKVVETPKPAPKVAATTKPNPAKPAPTSAAEGGPYWVQVGAFKEPEVAKQLAARLREQGLRAEESSKVTAASRPAVAAGGGSSSDRYDVVVSGASAADLDTKLAPKGMTGESTSNGIVVRPSLPLREAVGLSRELADAGLRVQVRRVGGPAAVATPAPAPAGETMWHRVRVGGFPDRATAMAAAKQLEAKGYKPFIARGNE